MAELCWLMCCIGAEIIKHIPQGRNRYHKYYFSKAFVKYSLLMLGLVNLALTKIRNKFLLFFYSHSSAKFLYKIKQK